MKKRVIIVLGLSLTMVSLAVLGFTFDSSRAQSQVEDAELEVAEKQSDVPFEFNGHVWKSHDDFLE